MEQNEIMHHVDHTLLLPAATWQEVQEVCDDAVKYETASVCISPCFVRQAADYLQGRVPVCTVIGFPNGAASTASKCFEAEDALRSGAEEIDMVVNLGWVKEGRFGAVEEEIRQVKKACGSHILKVIIETCCLAEEEKIALCGVVSRSGADYIKTSTGFGTAGATPEDVALFAEHVAAGVRIKAAGGISSFADAERFLELGADRLGTSRLVKLLKGRSTQIAAALSMLGHSYSPYSGFRVGAALRTKDGKLYTGCNVENAAFGPTNCAERTAFFKAVSEGKREFESIAIVGGAFDAEAPYQTKITRACPPCGVCRQVMREFCVPEDFRVILATSPEDYKEYTLAELLPEGFGPEYPPSGSGTGKA